MNWLAERRILILEDEVLLALEAEVMLREMGAIVIGPAHHIEDAMRLLDKERPDAAMLDVNIHGSASTEVAQRLASQRIPFILATGYGSQNDVRGAAAVIDKPYTSQQLQYALVRIFAPEPAQDLTALRR